VGEVIDYYFEFSDHILSMKLAPSKYCTYRGQNLDRVREYVWNADRIWVDGKQLVYVKNKKTGDFNDKVDEKEFMWIKLSAQDIK
jgi:hypothetical protein